MFRFFSSTQTDKNSGIWRLCNIVNRQLHRVLLCLFSLIFDIVVSNILVLDILMLPPTRSWYNDLDK